MTEGLSAGVGKNRQNTEVIGLVVGVTRAFFGVLAGFAQPIFGAATLTIIFHPVYTRLLALLRQRQSAAALLTLLVICITVIIPMWFIA